VNNYICNIACIHTNFLAYIFLHNWRTSDEMYQEEENNSQAEDTIATNNWVNN